VAGLNKLAGGGGTENMLLGRFMLFYFEIVNIKLKINLISRAQDDF
jgi:hypothetical protein